MENVADQVARDTANAALSSINGHEKVCTERWGEIRRDMDALRRGVEGLYNRIWQATAAILAVLLASCGYLIAHSFFGHT